MTLQRTFALTFSACLLLSMTAHTQANRPPNPYDSGSNDPFKTDRPRDGMNHDDDASAKFLEHRMIEARKVDRKRRMVDTANRLLVLTKQLQNDLKGREPGPDDEKRLDEIARLARQVKDQMRQ